LFFKNEVESKDYDFSKEQRTQGHLGLADIPEIYTRHNTKHN